MTNTNFKKALYDALIPEYVSVMRNADDTEREFSDEFEHKMQKLIKRRKKPYYMMINTVGKRIACFAVLLFVASSVTILSVDALRSSVSEFFVKIFHDHTEISSVDLGQHRIVAKREKK